MWRRETPLLKQRAQLSRRPCTSALLKTQLNLPGSENHTSRYLETSRRCTISEFRTAIKSPLKKCTTGFASAFRILARRQFRTGRASGTHRARAHAIVTHAESEIRSFSAGSQEPMQTHFQQFAKQRSLTCKLLNSVSTHWHPIRDLSSAYHACRLTQVFYPVRSITQQIYLREQKSP